MKQISRSGEGCLVPVLHALSLRHTVEFYEGEDPWCNPDSGLKLRETRAAGQPVLPYRHCCLRRDNVINISARDLCGVERNWGFYRFVAVNISWGIGRAVQVDAKPGVGWQPCLSKHKDICLCVLMTTLLVLSAFRPCVTTDRGGPHCESISRRCQWWV